MAENPWDNAPAAPAQSWDDAPDVNTVAPPGSQSEAAARDLRWYRFPLAAVESAIDIGGELAGMAGGSVAGGAAAGVEAIRGDDPMGAYRFVLERGQEMFDYEPRLDETTAIQETLARGGRYAADLAEGGMVALATQDLGAGREAMTGAQAAPDRPERVFRATGSPAAATATAVGPAVAATGLPPLRPVSRAQAYLQARRSPLDVGTSPRDIPGGFGGMGDVEVSPAAYQELGQALSRNDMAAVGEVLAQNPAIVAAFNELQIDFTPGMVSDSPAVRQVASGMKQIPGSRLRAQDDAVRAQLQDRVDTMIREIGETDPMQISFDLETRYNDLRDDVIKAESDAFDAIRDGVDQRAPINVEGLAESIRTRVEDIGGGDLDAGLRDTSLSTAERELFNKTHVNVDGEWMVQQPSYASLDAYRKKVGNAMGPGLNKPFSDADLGTLKQIYGELAETQGNFAQNAGLGREWEIANLATQARKGLEDQMTQVLGRDLARGSAPQIRAAASALGRGDTAKFDEFMAAVPEDMRPAIAANMIDQLINVGRQSRATATSIQTLDTMQRKYPTAYNKLMEYVPEEAQARINTYLTAAQGFFRSLESDNTSNTAGAIAVKNAIEDGTMSEKLFGAAKAINPAGIIGNIIRNASADKTDVKKNRMAAADELLASNELREAIREYAAGRPDSAQEILRGAQPWRQFVNTLTADEAKKMNRLGIMEWLFEDEDE